MISDDDHSLCVMSPQAIWAGCKVYVGKNVNLFRFACGIKLFLS